MLGMRKSDVPLVWGLRAASPAASHVEEHEQLQPSCPDLSANIVQRFDEKAPPKYANLLVGLDVWRALVKQRQGNEFHVHAISPIVVAGLGRCVDEDGRSSLRCFARYVNKLGVGCFGDSRNAPTNSADDAGIICLLDGKVIEQSMRCA